MERFKGKHIVITGAGAGIGKAIAARMAEEGGEVHVFEREGPSGQDAVASIQEAGGTAHLYQVDVTSRSDIDRAVDAIDRIDVLVNNAGIAAVGNVEATTSEEMDRVYEVNVKGVFRCIQACLPKLKADGGGAILNMASIASRVGIADRFAYSMTKGAVLAMTLSVAKDYVGAGIRCNCLCPARVRTPFVDSYLENHYADRKEEALRELSEYQPIGRMGTPEEIAKFAAFLCSDEASFVTGGVYDVDGGVTNLR